MLLVNMTWALKRWPGIVKEFAQSKLINILGGCCGTTPAQTTAGLALLDLSTGEFRATEFAGPTPAWAQLSDELGRLRPVELLHAETLAPPTAPPTANLAFKPQGREFSPVSPGAPSRLSRYPRDFQALRQSQNGKLISGLVSEWRLNLCSSHRAQATQGAPRRRLLRQPAIQLLCDLTPDRSDRGS